MSHSDYEKRLFAAAKRVPAKEYDHEYVSLDMFGDQYVRKEDCDRSWAWAVRASTWPRLDARDILENELIGEFPEDAIEQLDVAALQTAFDVWRSQQPECRYWIVDSSRIIVFYPDEEAP